MTTRADRVRGAAVASRPPSRSAGVNVGSCRDERRRQAREQRADERNRPANASTSEIEPNVLKPRRGGRCDREQALEPPPGEKNTRAIPPAMPSSTLSVRSWRTISPRPAPSASRIVISRRAFGGACQEQAGDVGARDQQDEDDGADSTRRTGRTGPTMSSCRRTSESRVPCSSGSWPRSASPRPQSRLRLLERHARLQRREHAQDDHAALCGAGSSAAATRAPRRSRRTKAGRHDADDRRRLAVQRHGPSNDVGRRPNRRPHSA